MLLMSAAVTATPKRATGSSFSSEDNPRRNAACRIAFSTVSDADGGFVFLGAYVFNNVQSN
jgi:hypothetical protein